MEGGVIHNHEAVFPQGGQQHFFDPRGDGQMRAAGFKEHRRQPVCPALGHDQIDAFAVVAADPSEDLSATKGPPMRSMGMVGKSALIKIHHIRFAVLSNPKAQRA